MARFRIRFGKLIAIISAVLALAFFSILATLESTRIVQRVDSSQEDTVGLISTRGWPWTFESTAPGYAHAQNISPLRFEIDAFFYLALCLAVVGIGLRKAFRTSVSCRSTK